METIRVWVEGFLRGRYSLAQLWPRAVRVLAAGVLIGAILVVGWLLIGPLLTIPRFSTATGPVVRNGVAAVMVCGKKYGSNSKGGVDAALFKGMDAAMKYVPEPRTGTWDSVRQGECVIWYHHPPGFEQRYNRQERAQEERLDFP